MERDAQSRTEDVSASASASVSASASGSVECCYVCQGAGHWAREVRMNDLMGDWMNDLMDDWLLIG